MTIDPQVSETDGPGSASRPTAERGARCASRTARSTSPGIPWANVAGAAAARASTRGSSSSTAGGSTPRPTGRSTLDQARAALAHARDPGSGRAAAAAADRRLPLLLRAHARAEVAPVPAAARDAAQERLPLPRLGHPRQDRAPSSRTAARADAEIVGSYDAIRWVPDAHVVPPGLDLSRVHADARRRTRRGRSSSTRPRTARRRARRT